MIMLVFRIAIVVIGGGSHTLEDDQVGLESGVRHLNLLNLILQALTNALCDGSAINLGGSHC